MDISIENTRGVTWLLANKAYKFLTYFEVQTFSPLI